MALDGAISLRQAKALHDVNNTQYLVRTGATHDQALGYGFASDALNQLTFAKNQLTGAVGRLKKAM